MRVNVYIWNSLKSPKSAKTLNEAVGYILETETKKGPATRTNTILLSQISEKMTMNEAELYAIKYALSRINIKCELDFYIENQYVASAVENGWLQQWKANDWRTKAGKDIANKKLWVEVEKLLEGHTVTWHVKEKHGYTTWIKDEVEVKRQFVAPVQLERTDHV